MNTYTKSMPTLAAIAGLAVSASAAFAQRSGGGVTGDARLHPGTWGSQRSSRSYSNSRAMNQNTAPVVRSDSTPTAVAQAPTERRSFSYEPSQRNESTNSSTGASKNSGSCCCGSKEAPFKAQPSKEERRSFSYEPSTSENVAISPVAPAPRMQSSKPSQWQRTSGTKAERNNQRN